MKWKLFIFLLLFLSNLVSAQNAHFWDGIEDFDGPTDENPVLTAQLDFYFDKLVAPLTDSITLEINRLIEKTSSNADLRDFILWHLLEKYRHPEYMNQDQIFVWLYDEYFSQLEVKDLNETNLALIREKAERLRRLALFNIAPDIKLSDSTHLLSLESDFTALFFYDHDCELCHQEIRDLNMVCAAHPEIAILTIDLNLDNSSGIEIRAKGNGELKSPNQYRQIANQSELVRLSETYDIETTPTIFVLDKEKRIIAKKIRAKQIPLIL